MDAQPLSTPGMLGHSFESTAGTSDASAPVQPHLPALLSTVLQNRMSSSAAFENGALM